MEKTELSIVTEIGTFEGLDIDDPTKKKIKDVENVDDLIAESIKENLTNTQQ